MHQRDKYLREIREWTSKMYTIIVGLNTLKDIPTREYLARADLNKWSHKNRIGRNVQILKHSFVESKTDTTTVVFKATRDSTTSVYGFLYCRHSAPLGPVFDFICAGPTYRSQDGEYRARMLPWKTYNDLLETYADIYADIEKVVVAKVASGALVLSAEFFYAPNDGPRGTTARTTLEARVNDLRFAIKLYMLCWAIDYANIHDKIAENHINPAYQHIMYDVTDVPALDEMRSRARGRWHSMRARTARTYVDVAGPDYTIEELGCGQKIFPLTTLEAIRIDDINFNVWREIYITNMMSSLVLNLITPSFPFVGNWFYIHNARATMFDNHATYEKYKHSDVATAISQQLRDVDRACYNADDQNQPTSDKFYRLSRYIRKAVVYANTDIRLTDLAICMTSEYVGRTLRDIPTLVCAREHYHGLDKIFSDIGTFRKHMFEFLYAFYCMNRAGVFHGDLHMNNVTIMRLYMMYNTRGELSTLNPHIVYIVGQTPYIFQHTGLFSALIDFSRAIIGDREKLVNEFGPRFADMHFREQRVRCMHLLYNYFPDFVTKNKVALEDLLINNFFNTFKVITAVDSYILATNISALFTLDPAFAKTIAPEAKEFLSNLALEAAESITGELAALMAGTRTEIQEWPNLVFLQKHFAADILTQAKMADTSINVVEIFNSNNTVTYDIEDPASWGPILSLDKQLELRKKYGLPVDDVTRRWLVFKNLDETAAVDQLLATYETKDKDTLQFESWMLM